MTSFFVQAGCRTDGRTFTVEHWLAEGSAVVSHADGSREVVALRPEELESIGLLPLELPPGPAFAGEMLRAC